MGIFPLNGNRIIAYQNHAVGDQMLQCEHEASYDDFYIFTSGATNYILQMNKRSTSNKNILAPPLYLYLYLYLIYLYMKHYDYYYLSRELISIIKLCLAMKTVLFTSTYI